MCFLGQMLLAPLLRQVGNNALGLQLPSKQTGTFQLFLPALLGTLQPWQGAFLWCQPSPAQPQCQLPLLLPLSHRLAAICDPAGDSPKAVQAVGCTELCSQKALLEVSSFITYGLLALCFAAILRFGAFVIARPLLGAGQDKQTL